MNQRLFCYLIVKPKTEVWFWFLPLEGESKIIQITDSENSNKNLHALPFANNTLSIIVWFLLLDRYEKSEKFLLVRGP